MRKLVKKYLEAQQTWTKETTKEEIKKVNKILEEFSKAEWEELLHYTYRPSAKCEYKVRTFQSFPEEDKSELVKQYLDLQTQWSEAACRGDMEEYERLGKKGHAVRDKFTPMDWAYLLIHTHNVHAKIYYHKRLLQSCKK